MRQRTSANVVRAPAPTAAEEEDAESWRAREQEQQKKLAAIVGAIVLLAPLLAGALCKWYWPHVQLVKTFQRPQVHRGFTADEVRGHLRNHTFLHVGALHRSGANLLWEGLHRHPKISGHSHKEHTDHRVKPHVSMYKHEGLKLQNVYPKYGLDHARHHKFRKWFGQVAKYIPLVDETVIPWVRLHEGVGRFALHPDHHLDEATPLVGERSQVDLFNQWALFWDLDRPVLMENSPTNMVISPFLHRLWGLGIEASPARFIFLRRHPIAAAMSTKKAGGKSVDDLTLADLVEHWLAAEDRLAKDLSQYFEMSATAQGQGSGRERTYRVVSLETLVQAPRRGFEDLVSWLGLPPSQEAADAFEGSVQTDPNAKYFKHYCMALMKGGDKHVQAHARLMSQFGERVRAVEPTYDLALVPEMCKKTLIDGKPAVEPSEADIESEMQEEGLDPV